MVKIREAVSVSSSSGPVGKTRTKPPLRKLDPGLGLTRPTRIFINPRRRYDAVSSLLSKLKVVIVFVLGN